MTQDYVPVDVSSAPELKRLAEAVRQTGKPHALKEGAETIAVVRPASRKDRAPRSGRRAKMARGRSTSTVDDPAFAQQLEEDLRANREEPVDRDALFAPPTPEVLERRRAVYDQIQAHRRQRVIAPLTAVDLIRIARAQEEEGYGTGR